MNKRLEKENKMRYLLLAILMVFFMAGPALADANQLMDINSPSAALAVTASTGSVAFGLAGADHIIIKNVGSNIAYVKSGISTITAAVTDTAIAAGEIASYRKSAGHTHLAAIADTGLTTTLKIQSGDGK